MRASSKHPKDEPSGVVRPPPTSTSDTSAEVSVNPAAIVPPPSTSDDFDIRRTLETIMTIQAAYGQLLVDLLDEIRALQADLEHFKQSPLPPPFDDGFYLPFGISSQKGGVHLDICRGFLQLGGVFVCWSYKLYLGASLCILPFLALDVFLLGFS